MAATMTTSAAFAAVLLCAAFLAAHAGTVGRHQKPKRPAESNGDVVIQACANATSDFCRVRLTKQFCVSELRSDKRSADAKDTRDLALIAMDLVKLSAAAADAKVDAVLRAGPGGVTKGDKHTERGLRYCRVDYDVVARVVPECRAMVEEYKFDGQGYKTAGYQFECANKLIHAAMGCQDQILLEDEVSKAAGKEVDEVYQRATLAKAILEQMLGEEDDGPDFS